MRVLGFFINTGGGIQVLNELISDAIEEILLVNDHVYTKKIVTQDIQYEVFGKTISEKEYDVIVTQDTFIEDLKLKEDFSIPIVSFCFPLMYEVKEYPFLKTFSVQPFELKENDIFTKYHTIPYDLSKWKSHIDWNSRSNLFCSITRLIPHRLNKNFLDLFQGNLHLYGELDKKGENFDILQTAVKNNSYKGKLDKNNVCNTLNNYKFHILYTACEYISLICLESLLSGTFPIVIYNSEEDGNSTPPDNWIPDWMPKKYMLIYDSLEKFEKDIPSILQKDFSEEVYLGHHWARMTHNKANFQFQALRILDGIKSKKDKWEKVEKSKNNLLINKK